MIRHFSLGLIVVVLIGSVTFALAEQNVPVTEARVSRPFAVDWGVVRSLAGRIFAEQWLAPGSKGEWSSCYPSPSRVTTTYGCRPAKGDSLTPVDDRCFQKRPGWIFWKERGRTGVMIEKGVRGNWIVSTFVMIYETKQLSPSLTSAPLPPVMLPQQLVYDTGGNQFVAKHSEVWHDVAVVVIWPGPGTCSEPSDCGHKPPNYNWQPPTVGY